MSTDVPAQHLTRAGLDRRTVSTARPTRRRRRLVPEDRKTELVDAAMRLLRAGVDEGNWVAKVTVEADAAKGTFYAYFPSWDDMLATIREQLLVDYCTPLRLALVGAGEEVNWWELLESHCERFIELMMEFPRHHAYIFHSPVPERPVEASRSGPAVLTEFIEAGMAGDAFGPVDAEVAATLLFAGIHSTADAVLEGGDRTRWVTGWVALARGYLAPTAAARRHIAGPSRRSSSA